MPNDSKRIDVSYIACLEKLDHFKSAAQQIDLLKSPDPVDTKALYEVPENSLGFVVRKHQDWFTDN